MNRQLIDAIAIALFARGELSIDDMRMLGEMSVRDAWTWIRELVEVKLAIEEGLR